MVKFKACLTNDRGNLACGDGEMRVIFAVADADVPAATELCNLRNTFLHVTARHEDRQVEFGASIPAHKGALGGRTFKVALDVPQSDFPRAAKLFAFREPGLVFNVQIAVANDTAAPVKESRRKSEPTPYGQFWRELDKRGFHNMPVVRAVVQAALDGGRNGEVTAKDLLRAWLGVESRSREASPEIVIAALQAAGVTEPAVYRMVEQAAKCNL